LKRIILTLLLSTLGWGAPYDLFLLETQLTLLPKIAMLEKNIVFPSSKSPMKILIAYDPGDEDTAGTCAKILMNKFNGHLNGHPIIVTALPFTKMDPSASYHLIYALKASLTQLKKVTRTFGTSAAVTALYDADELKDNGFLLSIRMERTPVILVNAKVMRENRFSFPDSLLEMARIIE
jgi:hypothetical protein